MLVIHAYPDQWASDWSEELCIEAAQDRIAPVAPSSFALNAVAEGIELTWINPTLNFDGTACNDLAWIAIYRKAGSGGIDPDTPASYDKRTLIQGESYMYPSSAVGTTFYFLLTAVDRTGNESEVTSELSESPTAIDVTTVIPDDASGLIFNDVIGGDGVVGGHALIGIAFKAPLDTWVNFDRYRLWWQYTTDGGSTWRDEDGVADQWTEIAPVMRWGFMHKGLDSTGVKAYRYKATVVATDGTESSTADTAGGASTTADGADNSAVVAETIFAMNIVALGEVWAENITCTNLAAITANLGAVTAGSIVVGTANKIWLNEGADGVLAIGGSTKGSAPFHVSAAGAVTATNLTLTGGSININSGVFTVSAAGAVVASSISCTNLVVGAGSSWGGNALGTAYIPNLSATKITSDTMVADRISGGTIGACTISANNITAGLMSFSRITAASVDIISSMLHASAVIYGKIAANAVRTSELYIDGNVNFNPDSGWHEIVGCSYVSGYGGRFGHFLSLGTISSHAVILEASTSNYVSFLTAGGVTLQSSTDLNLYAGSSNLIYMAFGGNSVKFTSAATTGGQWGLGYVNALINGVARSFAIENAH